MSASIVILTEEPSARIVIDELCLKGNITSAQVLQHAGKSDLEKSIARKINGWKAPKPVHFIITRDLDKNVRDIVKAKLLNLVPSHARERTKVRIVVPELEAWYLGDPDALREAGLINPTAAQRLRDGAQFRNLCNLQNAKGEFKNLVGNIGQIAAAELIAPWLCTARNTSVNFHSFVDALSWAQQMTSV